MWRKGTSSARKIDIPQTAMPLGDISEPEGHSMFMIAVLRLIV
jgi:hypothetical protein